MRTHLKAHCLGKVKQVGIGGAGANVVLLQIGESMNVVLLQITLLGCFSHLPPLFGAGFKWIRLHAHLL